MPPPPLPTQTWQPPSNVQQTAAYQHQPTAWNSAAVTNHHTVGVAQHQESDEWDDDWDDDDDNSSTVDAPVVFLICFECDSHIMSIHGVHCQ